MRRRTDAEKEIERYRAMISDPMSNPGFLNVDRGEVLWKTPRGAKNVILEQCDLGEGPGKLEGAYAKLPRYFKDADRVMDLEQRLHVVHAERCRASTPRTWSSAASAARAARPTWRISSPSSPTSRAA